MALTAKQIEQFKLNGKKEAYLSDGDNLLLRFRSGSRGISRTWLLRYTSHRLRKKISLGTYPEISLQQAREKAREQLAKLQDGVDPQAERDARKATEMAHRAATARGEVPETFEQLFQRWKSDYLERNRSDKGAGIESLFINHILPTLGPLRLEHIRPLHITTVLDEIATKGIARTAGLALSSMRQMYGFAIPRELTDKDPTRGLKKRDWEGVSDGGERVLAADEIRELADKLKVSQLATRWKHTIWFMLATGTRITETMLTERAHIDLSRREWFIPKENQKHFNRIKPRDHTVFLSDFAIAHLEALLALSKSPKYVFPANPRGPAVHDWKGDAPANRQTLTNSVRDRCRGDTPVIRNRTKASHELILARGAWTPHDLRRTMSTHMQEIGIDSDIIDKCQNHSQKDKIKRTYQRGELRRLMREAWHLWGIELERMYNGETTSYENDERNNI